MKFLKSLTCFFFLTLPIGNSIAAGNAAAGPIKLIQYYEGHVGMLIIQGTTPINPDLCERNTFYILRNTHPLYKEMSALVLSAHMNGSQLAISVSGCLQGLPSITHITSSK